MSQAHRALVLFARHLVIGWLLMLDFWFADENIVFAVALFILTGLVILQSVGFADFESDFDSAANTEGIGADILSFLGLGRLPLMLWLSLFLMLFSMIGYGGQQLISSMTGGLLPVIFATVTALILAVPATALLARPVARIMPKDETTAMSLDSLIGRFAFVEIGTASRGSPARAKVTDIHGHPHFIMVEPDNDGQTLQTGEKLLLVRRDSKLFRAISHGEHHLPRLEDKSM